MDGTCLELIGRVPGANRQPEALQERALIRQAQRGDRAAFEQLVRLYEASVLRLALQVVRSEEEARDLYQEAFLKIYRSLGRFRFDSKFSTWVYRVVMNVCLDHLRRRSTRREVQGPDSAPGQSEFFHRLRDERTGQDPEQILRAKQIAQKIEQALGRLTPRERLVFELKHYQGMKLKAIGEYCGTSEQTAKNCLFRATQKLRTELAEIM